MIKILLDNDLRFRPQARYTFDTFFEIIGVPVIFIENQGQLNKGDIFIYYGKVPIKSDCAMLAITEGDWFTCRKESLDFDVIATSFYFLSRQEEEANKNRDCWGCFPADFSIAHKWGMLRLPLINGYIENLKQQLKHLSNAVGSEFKPAPRWKDNRKFAAVLTHDVDNLHKYAFRNAARAISNNGASIGKAVKMLGRFFFATNANDPYWSFDDFIEAERRFGATSTFFVVSQTKNRRYDPYYMLDKALKRQLRDIYSKGWDVALHGSYDSFIDEKMLKEQKIILEKTLDAPVNGIRQHYLRFSMQQTPQAQQKAGFTYDSTLGYNEDIGFRAGLAAPFYIYDAQNRKKSGILELPLAVMDGSLFLSKQYTKEEAFNKVRELIDDVEAVEGMVVILWHNKARDEEEFPGWWETYNRVLDYLHSRQAWITDNSQVCKWWVERIKKCAA